MKKINYLFIVGWFVVTGCPAPDKYVLAETKRNYLSSNCIVKDELEMGVFDMYTWYDTRKRVIIFNAWVKNKSTEDLKFVLSDNKIITPTDTLEAINYPGKLVNEYRNKIDTVLVPAGEREILNIYFISRKDYTRSMYGKKKRNEIIQLQLNVFDKIDTTISLRYKPTPNFFWQ